MKWLIWIAAADAILGFIVAMTSSQDVLSTHPALNAYVASVAHIFPLEQYVRRSNFGEMARLYNAVVWPAFPIHYAVLWGWLKNLEGRQGGGYDTPLFRMKPKLSYADRIFLGVCWPVFAIVGVGALMYWHGGDTRLVHFGTSRIQLAIFGTLGPISSAAGISVGLASLKKAVFGRL